jgi:hypothetical protein
MLSYIIIEKALCIFSHAVELTSHFQISIQLYASVETGKVTMTLIIVGVNCYPSESV